MYLRKTYTKKTGRTYLSIVHGYRDSGGNPKQKTVRSLGYLDNLEKEYADPVAHFTIEAAVMEKERQTNQSVTVTLEMNGQVDRSNANRKNYGHIVFSKIYHEFEIDRFLKNARRHESFKFNTDAIMRQLMFNRLLYPGSKRASFLNKGLFFDNFNFSLDDIYHALGDGYIYSKSIRGASKEFKDWVLEKAGYSQPSKNSSFKLKSKIVPDAVINVTVKQIGKKKYKKKETVEQKWIVYYSDKYAVRAKHKREEAIEKALKMIENPAKYRRTFDYGAVGYIENLKIDKETGEIKNFEDSLILNTKKIKEEEIYDGYYAIVTSELDDPDEHIIKMYRELWRIEESFKVTKSVLEARPVYLHTIEHINAHFLICFVSLLVARIVEIRLGGKYTIAKITDSLRNVACSHIDQNLWLFDFADEVTDDCNAAFGADFGRKVMTLKEIKNNLGHAKNR